LVLNEPLDASVLGVDVGVGSPALAS